MRPNLSKTDVNGLVHDIIGAAIEVHKELGPGLLEKHYEKALSHELNLMRLKCVSQQKVTVKYKDIILKDCEMRYDLLVEDCVVVELKSTKIITDLHVATTLSYMKHLRVPKGIIINFNSTNIFHKGQKTLANEYFEALPEV